MKKTVSFEKPFSLSFEIGGMFILLGLLPLFLIGWQYYKGVEEQLTVEISSNLIAVADNKVESIETYAADRLREVQVLSNSEIVMRAIIQLNHGDQNEITPLADDLKRYTDNIKAEDILLLSASGKILFSAHFENLIGYDLPLIQDDLTQLVNVFDRARTLLEANNSDFGRDALSDEPTAYFAAPILRNGYVLGVTVLKFNADAHEQILSDYSGLGRTGETLVASRSNQMIELIGPMRFDGLNEQTLPKSMLNAFERALTGERNVEIINDYRQKEVIAVWRYVPSFRWALLVKIDVEERFSAIYHLRDLGFIFICVMAFLLITFSIFIARAITAPIRKLEMATRNLSEQETAVIVPEQGAWELNALAKGFNSMSQRIHSYQTGLRRMVDERTAELLKAKEEAEKATRAKSDFLAMMSHEIRTPLNGLMGMAELLKSQEMGPLAKDYVQTLHRSGAALSELLNDILDISRIEAGKLELHHQSFGPITLMQSLSALMKRSAEMKGLVYELEISPDIPRVVIGDPARLRQILLNITGNAIKFTAQGTISVSLGIKGVDDEKVSLLFEVKDTGIGIPLEEQHLLFQPFSQLGEGRSKRYGGAGLGLAISKNLAVRMGGDISLKSEVGKGACFSLVLPFAIDHENASEVTDFNQIEPLRILIVEDEPINRRVLSGLLRQDSHEVLNSASGEEAFEILKTEPVDVVLSDLRLPGMSGFEVIEKVHKDWKLPVLAVTANLMPDDVKKCIQAGAIDVIGKPISPIALRNALERVVHSNPTEKSFPLTVPDDESLFSSEYLDQLSEALPETEIRSLMEKAKKSVNEHLGNLMNASARQDIDALCDHAHKLSGVSGTYGMLRLRQIAKECEKNRTVDVALLKSVAETSLNIMLEWQSKN